MSAGQRLLPWVLVLAGVAAPAPSSAAACTIRTPVDAVLVLDRSGSMDPERIAAAADAGNRFLDALASSDRSGLVTYADHPSTDAPISSDHQVTRAALGAMRAGGLTATGAAILEAHARFGEVSRTGVRKVMVVLTDGVRNAGPAPGPAAATARAAGIRIFAVGLGDAVSEAELASIASFPSSVHVLRAATAAHLPGIFAAIARALGSGAAVAESYAAHARLDAGDAATTRATVRKINQHVAPTGSAGTLRDTTLDLGGYTLRAAAVDGGAGAYGTHREAAARAHARVTGFALRDPGGLTILSADEVTTAVQSEATDAAAASSGSARVAGLVVGGIAFGDELPPVPVDIPGVGAITVDFRDGVQGASHAGLRVTALHVRVQAQGEVLEISVASSWAAAACADGPAWFDPMPDEGPAADAYADPDALDHACRRVFSGPICGAVPDPRTLPEIHATCRQVLAEEVCNEIPSP